MKKFCTAYPQFIGRYVPNREDLIAWLRERNLACTFQNLATAFQGLDAEGKVLISPAAIGVSDEEQISGARLMRHPQLWKLLEPAPAAEQKEKLAERKLSANEY